MVDSLSNDYVSNNRDLWNKRVDIHINSPSYNMNEFIENENYHSLNKTEIDLIGGENNIKNKTILHLQCHFGLDTLSLARLGAAQVTGVDLSDKSIKIANEISKKTKLNSLTKFINCDIYDLKQHLDNNDLFDIVFTTYGTIKWLPDLKKWAHIISYYLKPNGIFIMVDYHPIYYLWSFDTNNPFATYSYFNQGPIVEKTDSYFIEGMEHEEKDKNTQNEEQLSIRWNHSISDILNSLIQHGLEINLFNEYDYGHYDNFNNLIKSNQDGLYRFKDFDKKLPILYGIKATKKN